MRGCSGSELKHKNQDTLLTVEPTSPGAEPPIPPELAAANETDDKKRETFVKNRDMLVAKMTPAQIAEARKLAREWKPTPK